MDTRSQGKLFAVGDIHGCRDQLVALLDRLPFNPARDSIVFLGDYINRGPQSREVVELLLDLEGRAPGAVFLMGNHERALLEYARTHDQTLLQLLRAMEVEKTLASYNDSPPRTLGDLSFLPPGHRDFLERLGLFHRDRGYLFVHAGVAPGQAPEDVNEDVLLDIRDSFFRRGTGIPEMVVFGHTPFETPLVMEDKIGLDTGAIYGNYLTAVELNVDPEAPRGAVSFYHA